VAVTVEHVAALAGAVTAVGGALALVAEWFNSRRARREFQAHVADDLAVVQFWEAWLRLHEAACDGASLGAARERAREAMAGLARFPPREDALAGRSRLRTILLLYWPPRLRALVVRVPFYLAAIFALVVPLTLVGDDAIDHRADPEAVSTIVLTVIMAAALAGLAAFLRTLARHLEEPE